MKATYRSFGCACALTLFVACPLAAAQQSHPRPAAERLEGTTRAMSKSDSRYLHLMAEANIAEVRLGEIAVAKADSAQVKQFAKHMVEDHGKMLSELKAMAASKNARLPQAPDRKHRDAAKQLERLSGSAFDRAYMEQMVQDHEATLKLLQQIADKADDQQLRHTAREAVPEVKNHLENARSIAAAAGARVSAQR